MEKVCKYNSLIYFVNDKICLKELINWMNIWMYIYREMLLSDKFIWIMCNIDGL